MPLSYFQDTPHEERLTHLRAILAARASGRLPSLDLRDGGNGSRLSGPMTAPALGRSGGQLHDRPLISAKIHSANDASLAIDTFEFGEKPRFDISDPEQTACMERAVAFAAKTILRLPKTKCVISSNAAPPIMSFRSVLFGFCQHLKIFRELSGTEGTRLCGSSKRKTIQPHRGGRDERLDPPDAGTWPNDWPWMASIFSGRISTASTTVTTARSSRLVSSLNRELGVTSLRLNACFGVYRYASGDLQRHKWVLTLPPIGCRTPTPDLANVHAEVLDMVIELARTVLVQRSTAEQPGPLASMDQRRSLTTLSRFAPTSLPARFDPRTTDFPSPTSP